MQTFDNLKTEIEAIQSRATDNRLRVQPFAVVVGADLQNITASYIWYDTVIHLVNSPRDAIDITFKIIHSLNAFYPKQSECYWLLLQKGIYKIVTPWDREISQVDSLLAKLDLN